MITPLAAKIIAQVIIKFGLPITWTIAKTLVQHCKDSYLAASPEKQAEWNKGWAKDWAVGEGKLPDTPGIVIDNAMDPKAHVDDKVGD